MRWSRSAAEEWDSLFAAGRPRSTIRRAMDVLDDLETTPDEEWATAEPVELSDDGIDVRRTVITLGPPPVFVYWRLQPEPVVLGFEGI